MSEISTEQLEEIHCLTLFDLSNTQEGLKVHQNARPETIEAIKRLHHKGLISQDDGGYLTNLGREAAEFTAGLQSILRD